MFCGQDPYLVLMSTYLEKATLATLNNGLSQPLFNLRYFGVVDILE